MLSTRVVACLPGGRTRIETRSVGPPGAGELLLEVRSCGLCGTDLFKLTYDKAAPGSVLGHEVVGTVRLVGQGVTGFSPGDRVVVPHHVPCGTCPQCLRGSDTLCAVFRENLMEPGGFSDLLIARDRAVRLAARKVPDDISDEAAIFLEPAACVLRGIWRSGLPRADREFEGCAVVIGGGSMGLLHLLVLRAVYPRLAIVLSDLQEDRLALARRLGAAAALPPGELLSRAVRELSGGLGADAVFDTVGGSRILMAALGLTREGGSVVLFAHAPEGDGAGFDLNSFFKNERRVLGTYSGSLAEQEEVFRLIASGSLDASPLVTHRLPLERFDEGVALCRKLEALKVLMIPGAESSP